MRYISFFAVTISTAALLLSGCGDSSIAPVSGTVTFDGKPADKLRITFVPQPVGDNYAPGPYSEGKTGSDGRFTLKTRYGDSGALVGKHKVSFEFTDISPDAMDSLNERLDEAKFSGNRAKVSETKKKIAKLKKKLAERPDIGQTQELIDIPAGGTNDLKIELGQLATQ